MRRVQVFLLVGMISTVFQVWSWWIMTALAALAQGYSMYKQHKAGQYAETENERARQEAMRPNEPYQRSEYMPDDDGYSPMARYSPRNRQPSSGIDPQLMQYLRQFTQPR